MSAAEVLRRSRPVVVLGVAPAERGARAWSGASSSGQRLAELAGYERPARLCPVDGDDILAAGFLAARFGLDNLVPYPDPSREALRDAGELYAFLPGFWYALAGTEVVRALGLRALPAKNGPLRGTSWAPPPCRWYESREGVTMAVLPHPSGRNRQLNDPAARRRVERFLREAAWPRGAHLLFERARSRAAAS